MTQRPAAAGEPPAPPPAGGKAKAEAGGRGREGGRERHPDGSSAGTAVWGRGLILEGTPSATPALDWLPAPLRLPSAHPWPRAPPGLRFRDATQSRKATTRVSGLRCSVVRYATLLSCAVGKEASHTLYLSLLHLIPFFFLVNVESSYGIAF